jgi:fibronectin-binding autotransporter adhesin
MIVRRSLLLSACCLSAAVPLLAQTTYTKANNTTSLSSAGSYVGNTTVPGSADTVLIDSTVTGNGSASIGAGLNINGITVTNPGGTFTISSNGTNSLTLGSGGINLSGSSANLTINAPVNLSASQTWQLTTGRTLILSNNSTFSENGNSANITGNGTFDYRAGGTVTFSGAMNQTSLFVNYINANLSLTNSANSFTTTAVNNGKLSVNSIGNFGQTSALGTGGTNTAVTIGSSGSTSTLEYTGATTTTNRSFTRDARASTSAFNVTQSGTTLTITGAMGSGTQLNSGTAGWTFGGAGNLVLMGAITNSTNATSTGTTITKNDSGTLTIGGTHSATGAITVNAGTLQIGAGGTTGSISNSANITNSSAVVFNRSDALSYSGIISGTGTVTNAGTGETTLTGVNTYSGKTVVAAGSLAFDQTGALGSNSALDLGTASTSSGSLNYLGSAAASLTKNIKVVGSGTNTIRNSGSALFNLTGSIEKSGTVLSLRGGSGGINVTGVISGSSSNSDLIIDGGTTFLNAANTYNGPTIITNGGNLVASVAGALPTSNRTALTLDPSGSTGGSILTLGSDQVVASLTGAAGSTVALQTTKLTVGTSTGSTTFAGNLTGAGSLLKDGSSTLILSGANTYTGNTRIDAGTLALGVSNTLADTSDVVFYGGTLAVGGFSDVVGTLTLANTAILDFSAGGSLSFADSSALTWDPNAQLRLIGSWTSLRFGTSATGLTATQLGQIVAPGTSLADFRLTADGYLYAAIPEPSTYALLGLGGVMCALYYRRRRRA